MVQLKSMDVTTKNNLTVKNVCGGCIIDKSPVFSKDGSILFVSQGNAIKAYNTSSGEYIKSYNLQYNQIVTWEIQSSDEEILLICTNKGEIIFWNWKTGIQVDYCQLKILNEAEILNAVFLSTKSPETLQIVAVWSLNDNKYLKFSLMSVKYYTNLDAEINREHAFYLSVGVNSNLYVLAQKNKIYTGDIMNKSKKCRHLISEDRFVTALCFHPHEECFATGDNTGRVLIWRQIFKSKTTQAVYHWHTMPVNSIVFSPGGTHMYTGGKECVLVKWVVDIPQHKNFLPRVAAPIKDIVVSQNNTLVAFSMINNVIHLIDNQRKLKTVIENMSWGVVSSPNGDCFSAGIHFDSRTQSIIMNSNIGHIQFYDIFAAKLLYNLDITSHNQLTEEQNFDIINIDVIKMDISDYGFWLATVEERNDTNAHFESRLKFWNYNSVDQTWILNTCVSLPHENGVIDVKFKPSQSTSSEATTMHCVTIGKDQTFKIWSLIDNSTIYKKGVSWRIIATAYYKNYQPSCLDFSYDGSLVAIGFSPSITVWLPETCELKCSLIYTPYANEQVKKVLFGNAESCHCLVSTTDQRIYVWNLLSLTVLWSVPLKVSLLVKDIKSSNMAAFTDNNKLFVFSPQKSQPIYIHENICLNNRRILQAVFVPHTSTKILANWQQFSQLYFIDSNQEMLTLQENTSNESSIHLELITKQLNVHNPLLSLRAQTVSSSVREDKEEIYIRTNLPGSVNVQELIKVPSHTCAPMRYMCESVLKSLLISSGIHEDNEFVDIFKEIMNDSSTDNAQLNDDSDDEILVPVKQNRKSLAEIEVTSKSNQNIIDENKLDTILNDSTDWYKKFFSD